MDEISKKQEKKPRKLMMGFIKQSQVLSVFAS
jgi:hypothetical protein